MLENVMFFGKIWVQNYNTCEITGGIGTEHTLCVQDKLIEAY